MFIFFQRTHSANKLHHNNMIYTVNCVLSSRIVLIIKIWRNYYLKIIKLITIADSRIYENLYSWWFVSRNSITPRIYEKVAKKLETLYLNNTLQNFNNTECGYEVRRSIFFWKFLRVVLNQDDFLIIHVSPWISIGCN